MSEVEILNTNTPSKCFCVKCGEELTTEIKVCPYCGRYNIRYKYGRATTSVSTSQQSANAPQKCFCYRCGNQVNINMKFCNKCGAKNLRYSI